MNSALRPFTRASAAFSTNARRSLSNASNATAGPPRVAASAGRSHKYQHEAEENLSLTGKLFFGSLCASTFGLGVWQARGYFEKIEQMEARETDLAATPAPLERGGRFEEGEGNPSHRRVVVSGSFRHADEMLMGPRGPPPGALAASGPSSGRSSGGMSSGPQGYFVITPLVRSDNDETVLVNRGWVPMSFAKKGLDWSRPGGTVEVVGVITRTEAPKMLSPQHDKRSPRTLLWMDRTALEEGTRTTGQNPILLTETFAAADAAAGEVPDFPVRPNAQTVGEFKVTPVTHAGYAVTWFGLSGAGMVMTRKLLMRGRG